MNYFFNHLLEEFQLPLHNPVLVFSLILLIILLSPLLLKRINIPGIIGLIISGVVIGPHGLNLLEKNSATELFSTIGLLYIMFIAGLELDMNEFKSNRNKSLLFGFFTFIIPISIGFPVCYYLLGYGFDASFLTASMFATHTLVAYPIVNKLGISKNQAVAVTVGGTILTDTAVLIILAVVMGKANGTLNQEFWIRLGVSLSIFMAIMFLIVPRVAKWFFSKLESEKHSHYIFVLSVVFFAAFLAEVAGVEPIIGAFMAGLALNKLIPHSSVLMNRIEFIGNSLFIPFFLISVGMLVDARVILSGPMALVVAGALTTVALFGKWMAALFTRLIFKYTRAQGQLIFGLSSAHAAATLAVILVGYKANILDENILNGTIILILITCIVASFATERAGKRIVVEQADEGVSSSEMERISDDHILVPVANPENMEKLLEFSQLIKDKKSVNPITLLSIVPNNEEAEMNLIKSKSKLQSLVGQIKAADLRVNTVVTIDHNIASGIARTSREIMAELIVIGWPQKAGMIDKLMGDKVESLVNSTDKTLMICQFTKPFVSQNRIVMLAPPMAELEKSFPMWFGKIVKASQELSRPIVIYVNKQTQAAIEKHVSKYNLSASIQFKEFNDWNDFLVLARELEPTDTIVLVSARKGAVSFISELDVIPFKLEKHFGDNNKVLIYPQQFDHFTMVHYEDISSGPLNKGLETIQKIGKEFGSIFKKTDADKNL